MSPADFLSPIHREGYPFLAIFLAVTAIAFMLWEPLGWLGTVLTAWCAYFFRDPPRVTPERQGCIVSPADGIILACDKAAPPPEINMGGAPHHRVSIFMSALDCHINRAPVAGTVENHVYRPGLFFNASLDKASQHNERCSLHIRTDDGSDIAVVQIAGLLARRIVNWGGEGRHLKIGERFGMIRFGSRVELYLPLSMTVLALRGQTVIAGETVLAHAAQAAEKRSRPSPKPSPSNAGKRSQKDEIAGI